MCPQKQLVLGRKNATDNENVKQNIKQNKNKTHGKTKMLFKIMSHKKAFRVVFVVFLSAIESKNCLFVAVCLTDFLVLWHRLALISLFAFRFYCALFLKFRSSTNNSMAYVRFIVVVLLSCSATNLISPTHNFSIFT